LRTSLVAMQWVVNAYTLCMAALLLLGGAAADQFGRRLMFIIGVSVFAAASIGCGLASNVEMLIAMRAAQGTGAALLIPCALALIGAAFDEQARGAAIGIWAGASAIAAGVAPLLGGWLVDHSSWRMIFLINPVIALPTLWIAVARVPESRDPDAAPGVDWRGALLAVVGLGSLVYGLHAWMGRCRGREFPRGRGGAALRVRRGGTHRFPAHDAARAFSLAALQRDQSADALPVRRARSRVLLPALPAHPGPWLFGHGSRRRLRALYPGGRTVVAWIRVARKQNRHAGAARRRADARGGGVCASRQRR